MPDVNHSGWTQVPRRTYFVGSAVAAVAVAIGCSFAGCSCSRRPEWDTGLRETKPSPASRSGRELPQGSRVSAAEGSGVGPSHGSDQSGSGGGGSGKGAGTGGDADETGRGGDGSGGNGTKGSAAEGPADGGGQQGGPAAGNQAGGEGGTADDPSLPPAALPGRPRPAPRYDAKTAIEVAERRLRQADSNRSQGDLGNAYTAALEAFEAVEPHAATDDACRQVLGQAKRLLDDLAESQNRETRPRAVPTYFE